MAAPVGFAYVERKSGEIVVLHHGRVAAVLRGRTARQFLARLADGEEQDVMARFSGNYKRGTERGTRSER